MTSEPPSKINSVADESLAKHLTWPTGNKKTKLLHQQDKWQESLAKAQLAMVKQPKKQNELLASQSDLMRILAEDS